MDASFWVAVAFVLFVALIAKRGYQFITEGLDKRAGRIKTELEEAVRLREEAQALLAGYQRKQRDAVRDAEEIVERANREAARIAAQAEEDLAAALERRTRVAEITGAGVPTVWSFPGCAWASRITAREHSVSP